MAAPTITYYEDDTFNKKCSHGFKFITGLLTFTTYSATTTSGVQFDLSTRIPTKVHFVGFDNTLGYVPVYDYTNKRIRIYEAGADSAALDEVSDGAKLSGDTMSTARFFAVGK